MNKMKATPGQWLEKQRHLGHNRALCVDMSVLDMSVMFVIGGMSSNPSLLVLLLWEIWFFSLMF